MPLTGKIRPVLVLLVLLIPGWGCSQEELRQPAQPLNLTLFTSLALPSPPAPRATRVVPPPPPASPATYAIEPSACERFSVQVTADGSRHYSRIRKPWTRRDVVRFSKLVDLVAREMGADPRLFRAWSMRESSHRPSAVHVLNPDVEAAQAAWRKYAYEPARELALQRKLAALDPVDPEYWQRKTELVRLQTFRENAWFRDVLAYDLHLPDGTISRDFASIWAFGYGPFGFNPTYYLPIWDEKSPPWVFCGDDGLVAIITAIWAAREHKKECKRAGVGDSYLVLNRRFASGHCVEPPANDPFADRLRRLGVNPQASARLGRRWPRAGTDRARVLDHMRTRARKQGLLDARPRSVGS